MSLPPRAPLNVALLDALDRLGLKGGVLPTLIGDVTPVMIMGDLSRAITPELVDARKIATINLADTIAPAKWLSVQVQAISGGGLVADLIRCGVTNDTVPVVNPRAYGIVVGPDPTVGTKDDIVHQVDIGGLACASRAVSINSSVFPGPAGTPPPSTVFIQQVCYDGVQQIAAGQYFRSAQVGMPIYVPPGEFLTVFSLGATVPGSDARPGALFGILSWRELQAAQG